VSKLSEARRKVLVRAGDLSGETETPRVRRRLVVRGRDSSCRMETPHARRKLVVEATDQSEVRCLASEGLDEDLYPSLSWILALMLSMVLEGSISRVIILLLKGP
jgi:hypothetical protein